MYLGKDLLTLLNIMNLFNKYIYEKFKVQMTESLSVERLSFNIFKKDYLKKSKIPIIKNDINNHIDLSYYKDIGEVYKPQGKNLLYYNINSLYSYAALNDMCGDKYTFVENIYGDNIELDSLFGFFYCKIEASELSYLGLLPLRTKEGLLSPVGNWNGWYFSEELKFARDNGYNITVIKGYNFNKESDVFNKFIFDLNNLKFTTTNSIERYILENLLDSLLGNWIVKEPPFKLPNSSDLQDYSEFKDMSLIISPTIIAYVRIYLNKLKLDILNKNGNIYYIDEYNLITDIELDDQLIGDNLGQLKLVHQTGKDLIDLKNGPLEIEPKAYNKRVKIFNSESKWIDSKPAIIANQLHVVSNINIWCKFFFKELLKFIENLFLFLLAIIIVCITADLMELNPEDPLPVTYEPSSTKDPMIKPKILEYLNNNNKPTNYINNDYRKTQKICKIYTKIINEIISNNVMNNEKFSSLRSMVDYSKIYLLKEIRSGRLKITTKEFEDIVKLIYDIKKNNHELYKYVCEEPSLYNIVSKPYVSQYEIQPVYSNNSTEFQLVKNKLTIWEESSNSNYKLQNYEFNNKNIRNSLTIPRSEIENLQTLNSKLNGKDITDSPISIISK